MPLVVSAATQAQQQHSQDIETLIFAGDNLYSGADDGLVKMWTPTLQLVNEFRAHRGVVNDIAVAPGTLFTCSNDCDLKAWSAPGKLRCTLSGHEESVRKMYVAGTGILYSGDDKGEVFSWVNDMPGKMYNMLEEVWGLLVRDNYMYTVRDKDVTITDIGSRGKYYTKKTIMGRAPICFSDEKLCFANREGTEILVHGPPFSGFMQIGILKGHTRIINAICGAPGRLYSGGYDNILREWDLNTMTCTGSVDLGGCINYITLGPDGELYVAGSGGCICRVDVK